MKLKRKHFFLLVLLAAVITFFLGPRPDYPKYDHRITPSKLMRADIASTIAAREAQIDRFKPGNESVIQWADSLPSETEYVVLFLHGFGASPFAGQPLATEFAKRYGCNYYAPLLAGHGRDTEESFVDLSPADLVNSAKDALAIAQRMGRKVLLFGSSTGCTLGAYLAAHNPELVYSQFYYSPNFDLAAATSRILLWPWGKQIATLISGKYFSYKTLIGTPSEQYWTTKFRVEGLQALKYLIAETMTDETFAAIRQPTFVGYWYKNEKTHDQTISIPRLKAFMATIQTPEAQKRAVTFANVDSHVLLCDLQCKDIADVTAKTQAYAEEVLGMKPI